MLKGNGLGYTEGPSTGSLTRVLANATGIRQKVGGTTFDWSTVPVLGSDLELPDGSLVKAGTRLLRYGMFIAEITQLEVQTITITGTPTGGSYTLAVTRGGVTKTTAAIAYNATAAQVAAALNLLSNVDGIASGSGTSPQSITFNTNENVAVMVATSSLTGGSSPAVTIGTTTQGVDNQGYYGLYDTSATDGRQNRTRGKIFFVDQSVVFTDSKSAYVAGLYGGVGFKERLALDDSGGTPAAGYMTTAQFEAAFPLFSYV